MISKRNQDHKKIEDNTSNKEGNNRKKKKQ